MDYMDNGSDYLLIILDNRLDFYYGLDTRKAEPLSQLPPEKKRVFAIGYAA